VLKERLPGFDS